MSTAILLPIALVQGFWLLKRTPSLPIPEGRCGRFGTGQGRALQVVGIGDSVIAGSGVGQLCDSVTAAYARMLHEQTQRDVEWHVAGRVGATTAQILEELLPDAPRADAYVISGGVNDTTRGVSPVRFAENLQRIFAGLRAKSPDAVLLYCGLPPLEHFPALPWPLNSVLAARARAYQRHALEIIARDPQAFCYLFPSQVCASQFASDGFHPAEAACAQWAAGLLNLWLPAATAAAGVEAAARPSSRPVVVRLPRRRPGAPRRPEASEVGAAVAAMSRASRGRTG